MRGLPLDFATCGGGGRDDADKSFAPYPATTIVKEEQEGQKGC